MIGKRGQEMSISTLVLIVLAIIVLVLVVIGVSGGFGRVGDFFGNLGGGKSNVQTVIQGCQVACQTNSEYDWCSRPRDLTFETPAEAQASGLAGFKDGERKIAGVTCDALAAKPQFSLSCDAITTCPRA